MKYTAGILFIMVAVIFFIGLNLAYSSERVTTIQVEPAPVHVVIESAENETTINNVVDTHGVASAIAASQIDMNWGTKANQFGFGYGNHKNNDAFAIGYGKRIGDKLYKLTIIREGSEDSFGAGLNLHF